MAWLLSKADLHQVASSWRGVAWLWIAVAAPLLQVAAIVLRSFRQRFLLLGCGVDAPAGWLSLVQIKANFVRSFVPGGISADIYRTYVVARATGRGFDSVSAMLADKLWGVAGLLLLGTAALLYGSLVLRYEVLREAVGPVLFGIGASTLLVLLALWLGQRFLRRRAQRGSGKASTLLARIRDLGAFVRDRGALLRMSLLSLLIPALVAAWYYTVARAAGFELPWLSFLLVVPVVEVLVLLPLSFGGLGVREGAFIVLFAPFGLGMNDALSLALLCFFVATLTRILSGLAFLVHWDPRAASSREIT
jgi:uncharacterized protein (TIRG00374 family)